jgi:hypothetical protein
MTVEVGIFRITPEKAARLIETHNTHNRDVDERRIDQYAADMRSGDWEINGEAIKIADDGTLLDGQHRLLACLEAELPFDSIVVTGLSRKAQESMDQGRPRGLHDVLKLRGEGDPNVLARAVRIVTVYEATGVPYLGGWKRAPTNHESLRTLERNPEIRDACKYASRRLKRRWLPVSLVGALHFLFCSVDEEASIAFFDALTGDEALPFGSPILTLRQVLLADLEDPERRLHNRTKTAFIVIAWNAWRAGRQLPELRWSTDQEFPPIHGLIAQALAA